MEFISHRVNKIEDLKKTPIGLGIEIDLRAYKDTIVLEHDPFVPGDSFEDYLKHYQHGTLILNVKCERIEYKILELLEKYNIENYFFLDSSFPMIFSLSTKNNISKFALRFSEVEGMDTIRNMQGKCEWIWVDCFTRLSIDKTIFDEMKFLDFKVCLVSPELQGRSEDIVNYKKELKASGINLDAVCSKYPNFDKWMN